MKYSLGHKHIVHAQFYMKIFLQYILFCGSKYVIKYVQIYYDIYYNFILISKIKKKKKINNLHTHIFGWTDREKCCISYNFLTIRKTLIHLNYFNILTVTTDNRRP